MSGDSRKELDQLLRERSVQERLALKRAASERVARQMAKPDRTQRIVSDRELQEREALERSIQERAALSRDSREKTALDRSVQSTDLPDRNAQGKACLPAEPREKRKSVRIFLRVMELVAIAASFLARSSIARFVVAKLSGDVIVEVTARFGRDAGHALTTVMAAIMAKPEIIGFVVTGVILVIDLLVTCCMTVRRRRRRRRRVQELSQNIRR